MPVTVGDTAPGFELFGKKAGPDAPLFRLSDALANGGVVLQFFPLPFTGVCQAQMHSVKECAASYAALGVTVWGITGHYPQLIDAWDKEQHFDVAILADYDHVVSEAYVGLYGPEGPMPQGLRFTTKRGVVGIDREGIVRFVWVTDVASVPPSDAVIADAIAAAGGSGGVGALA